MNSITIKGKGVWRIESETETRMVLIRNGVDVRKVREAAGLTTRAAAPLLGISQAQLVRIENGTRSCPQSVLDKLGALK